jgi:hypothetical protein
MKRHKPTAKDRKEILQMAGIGLTQEQIATVKDFSVDTLTKYYSHELEIGVASLNAAVAGNLYRIATSDKAGAGHCGDLLAEDTGRLARDQPAGGQSRQRV